MGSFCSSDNIMSWLIIFMTAVVSFRVHGQSPQGFISIDCGIGTNNSYTDDVTHIQYTWDAQFIDTGVDYNISGAYFNSSPDARTSNLRSFPDGSRNCYTLTPVVESNKYVVRAIFFYGNYDGRRSADIAKPFMFDLHVDVNYWRTVNVTDAGQLYWAEIITVAKGNFISICLVNIGSGTPFISALELRPLQSDMYLHANTTQSLNIFYRGNSGSTGPSVRYPDDPFDRIWWSWTPKSWTTISTSATSIYRYSNDQFFAPLAVMKTAAVPINSTILDFSWTFAESGLKNNKFFVNLYFMELLPNTSRAFSVYVSDQLWSANFTPPYLGAGFLFSLTPLAPWDKYSWALSSSGLSTLPPILNALEVYSPLSLAEVATNSGDVDAITNIKMQYQIKKNWAGDPCSPEQYIWDGIKCNYGSTSSRIIGVNLSSSGLSGLISSYFANLTAVQYLNLSNNNLTGPIPGALGNLGSLQLLDLSNNNLTGPIPGALGNLESLQLLNISCNNFTGTIPSSLLERSQKGLLEFLKDCPGRQEPHKKDKHITVMVSISVVAAVLFFIVVFLAWRTRRLPGFLRKINKQADPRNTNNTAGNTPDYPFQLEGRQFTYMQLAQITSNFSSVIGRGGFGIVYLGYMENGEQVAIKMCARPSRQDTKEFLAEVQNLTRIHHRNLVSLIGYCMDGDNLALVYEYMSQGSLYEHLRGKSGKPGIISWRERLRIAVEAAQGLEYLHKGCNPPIVHRDIKTNNILLGSAFEAKIADFGLSKAFISNFQTHVSTMAVSGTPGYVDPEYHNTLQLTEKSDVYSFGVVLLELITGLPPIMPSSGIGHIVQRVSSNLARGDVRDIVDERLRGKYDTNSVWKVLDLAMRCTAQRGNQRPTMSYVVSQLKDSLELVIASEKNDNSNSTRESDTSQSTAYEIGMSIPEPFGPSAR